MIPLSPKKTQRLQVVLAHLGIASRRASAKLIQEGRVCVNGTPVYEKGYPVDIEAARILVDGKALSFQKKPKEFYYLFHKPKGVTTTLSDPHAKKTLKDFFGHLSEKLYPVGRLDKDTTGLLLITNDGQLAFRLSHPSYGIEKTYEVRVVGRVSLPQIRTLERGVMLGEGKTAPCKIRLLDESGRSDSAQTESLLHVNMHEGKKRQIRRMFEMIHHPIVSLRRIQYGPLTLGDLVCGHFRALSRQKVLLLRKDVRLVDA